MLYFRVAGDLGIGCAQIAHGKFVNIIISGESGKIFKLGGGCFQEIGQSFGCLLDIEPGSQFRILSRDALRVTRNPSLPVRNILWGACRKGTWEGVRSLRR